VQAVVDNPRATAGPTGFVEANGYVSMEADHYTRSVAAGGVTWRRVPDIGRTGAGMEPFPVTASRQVPAVDDARLEYDMTLTATGPVSVWAYLSPRNNVLPTGGLTYAVSVDSEPPQLVNATVATGANDTTMNRQWERNTSDNVNLTSTTHEITQPGVHTLKLWVVDPTVVVQKLVVDTGGLKTSYLGPPESYRVDPGGRR
jgi:Gylcosyl hydrolase family 115 C-terminal domain